MQSILILIAGLVASVSASCAVPGGLNSIGETGEGCQFYLCNAPERGRVAFCDAPNSCAHDIAGSKCIAPDGTVFPANGL
ncbi:hypothetical protein GQ53DRAFT_357874 [Thozetella sp. PMI_491]|nr:hypothetical protein GQ53DRAFT_357874 [Thozetella sp. PMI_491]